MNPLISFLADKKGSPLRDLALLALTFGIAFFAFLGRLPLIDPDEGRYAEIPREMLEKGDFVTPYLNYVKYFEKPPLHYWLNALSFKVFGLNEFAARFPAALCGLLTVLATYHLGKKLFGRREGLLAAIILGTSVGFVAQGRFNIIDMTLTFCMTACLGVFLLAVREGEARKALYYRLFYIFAGLTVLAKGLIGVVLPGGIIVLFILCTRRWQILKEMRLVTGTLLFLAVTAPWFVLVSLRNPEFPHFFFIREHLQRFTSKVHGRYQPPWFFIPVLLGMMFPWTLFIPRAISRWREDRKGDAADGILYLLLWFLVIFGFFSASSSKLIPYILPVFPPVALLVARAFSASFEKEAGPLRPESIIGGVLLTIAGTGVLLYPHVIKTAKLDVVTASTLGALFLCEGLLLLFLLRREAVRTFAAIAAISLLISIIGPPLILTPLSERKSSKEMGEYLRNHAGADTKIYSLMLYDQGLSFYAGRRVILVNMKSELEFGSEQGNQSAWFIDYPTFCRQWREDKAPFAIVKNDDLATVTGDILTTKPSVLVQDKRKALIGTP